MASRGSRAAESMGRELRVGTVWVRKAECLLRLTGERITWVEKADKTRGGTALLEALFGADMKREERAKKNTGSGPRRVPFMVRAMPLAKDSNTKRQVKSLEFVAESETEASEWVAAIREAVALYTWYESPSSPWQLSALVERQPVLILINPVGGTRKAPSHYRNTILPMLRSAGLQHEMKETERAGHATEIGRNVETGKYSAIVTVSGDGLLHELLQGLMDRPDWAEAIQTPVSIIPGGSGNGLMRSLFVEGQMAGTFNVIKGFVHEFDLMSISNFDRELVCYSHLAVFWAILADADIESERYRWAGPVRFTIGAVVRLLNLRSYHGVLHYLPLEDSPVVDHATEEFSPSGPDRKHLFRDPNLPPPGWQTVDTHFVLFCAANVGWLATDAQIAPYTCLSDGAVDLIYIEKGIPKSKLVKLFLDLEDGTAIENSPDCVKYVKARAFALVPKQEGIMDADGEVINNEPLICEVHPGIGRVIAPSYLSKHVPEAAWEGSRKQELAIQRKK